MAVNRRGFLAALAALGGAAALPAAAPAAAAAAAAAIPTPVPPLPEADAFVFDHVQRLTGELGTHDLSLDMLFAPGGLTDEFVQSWMSSQEIRKVRILAGDETFTFPARARSVDRGCGYAGEATLTVGMQIAGDVTTLRAAA